MASGPLLDLVLDIVTSGPAASGIADGDALLVFRKDCTDLIRRIALLTRLLEEIRNFACSGHSPPSHVSTSYSSSSWSPDLAVAVRATKRLLLLAGNFSSSSSSDGPVGKIASQFQCVTWKLEKALSSIPDDHFGISEEVQEQVELVRSQLRRATKRYGSLNSKMLSLALTQLLDEEIDLQQSGECVIGSLRIQNTGSGNNDVMCWMLFQEVMVQKGEMQIRQVIKLKGMETLLFLMSLF